VNLSVLEWDCLMLIRMFRQIISSRPASNMSVAPVPRILTLGGVSHVFRLDVAIKHEAILNTDINRITPQPSQPSAQPAPTSAQSPSSTSTATSTLGILPVKFNHSPRPSIPFIHRPNTDNHTQSSAAASATTQGTSSPLHLPLCPCPLSPLHPTGTQISTNSITPA